MWRMCLSASLLAACATPARSGEGEAGADRPNVILVMADDLGWGDPGFQGGPAMTPHLDGLASEGLVFERFYAAAPVCSPTRGSCLTGRHPYRYGITHANRGSMPDEEVTLAELLRDAGYATGHFGKWHLGTLTRTVKDSNRGGPKGAQHYAPPQDHGFDVCFSTEAKVPTYDPMVHPETGEPYGTAYWNERGEVVTSNLEGDDSRVIMDRVLPFVEGAVDAERPFFCVIWFHTPHLPVKASAEDRAPFAGRNETQQHYYGSIRAMDREVGRLHAKLRELGVARDTLVFFTSDNGPEGKADELGSTGGLRGRKRSLHEGGIRVPGIAWWPGRIAPGRTSTPAVTSDYLPTICELVDIAPPARPLDGTSLVRWLEGSQDPREKPIGFLHGKQRAWIHGRHKLHGREQGGEVRWSAFDVEDDPGEERDRFGSGSADERVRAFEAWRAAL